MTCDHNHSSRYGRFKPPLFERVWDSSGLRRIMTKERTWVPVPRNPQLVSKLKHELLRIAGHLEKSRAIRHDEDGATLIAMIGFFMLRKLIQDRHVTKNTTALEQEVFRCDFNDAFNADNRRWIDYGDGVFPATYSRTATKLGAQVIANKFVHAGYCVPLMLDDGTHEFLVLEEDRLREGSYHEALVVPVSVVVGLFKTAAEDDSDAFKAMEYYESKLSTN